MSGKTRRLGLLVLVLAAASARPALAHPAYQTTATVEGEAIRVKAFVEISGDGASEAMAAVIEGQINGVWQASSNQHTYCGRKVEFETEVRVRQGSETDGWHQVTIVDDRAGQYHRSSVDPGNPYDDDLGGTWTSQGRPGQYGGVVYAHEAGHLFGAPDEYVDAGAGQSQPNPGRERTLMSESAVFIDSTVVNHILSRAFPDGDDRLPRCIQGTYTVNQRQEKGIVEDEVIVSLDIEIQPDESGKLRGLAVGYFNLSGIATEGDCSFGYVYDQDLEIELAVTGSGDGPYKIEGDPPASVEGQQRHALCEDPVDVKIEWTVDPFLEEVVFGEFTLPNGRQLERQYDLHESDDEGTTDVHLWLMGAEPPTE